MFSLRITALLDCTKEHLGYKVCIVCMHLAPDISEIGLSSTGQG